MVSVTAHVKRNLVSYFFIIGFLLNGVFFFGINIIRTRNQVVRMFWSMHAETGKSTQTNETHKNCSIIHRTHIHIESEEAREKKTQVETYLSISFAWLFFTLIINISVSHSCAKHLLLLKHINDLICYLYCIYSTAAIRPKQSNIFYSLFSCSFFLFCMINAYKFSAKTVNTMKHRGRSVRFNTWIHIDIQDNCCQCQRKRKYFFVQFLFSWIFVVFTSTAMDSLHESYLKNLCPSQLLMPTYTSFVWFILVCLHMTHSPLGMKWTYLPFSEMKIDGTYGELRSIALNR